MDGAPRPLPWIIGFLVLALVMIGCAVRPVSSGSRPRGTVTTREAPSAPIVLGPRLDHTIHAEDLDCTDCHEMNEETGQPGTPDLEFCIDCHEDVDEEKPPEEMVKNVFFDEQGQPKWRRALKKYDAEVKWNHARHATLDCAICHGTMEVGAGRRSEHMYNMDQCMQCHEQLSAANSCEACHNLLNTDTAPSSHHRNFMRQHGGLVYRGDRAQVANRCETCHRNEECDTCHQQEEPLSHRRLWTEQHGQVFKSGNRVEQDRCKTCHYQPAFCETCHLAEQPRSHTHLFRTRTHGVMAAIDRTSCMVCHQTDFCVRCHEETEPLSHRGQFAFGRNTHCVNCHFPIQSEPGCSVCHQTNPTHSTAPAQPPTHTPGANCRACHNTIGGGGAPPLRHIDNGMACEFCHK